MKPWGRTLLTLSFTASLGALPALNLFPSVQWILQLVVLTWLLKLIVRLPRQHETSDKVHRLAFMQGWAFGFGWIIASVYWLYIAMHRFGDMPAPLAVIALILFSLFIGIFPGISLYAASKLRRDSSDTVYAVAIIPACFALGEWIRGWFLTGFPWNVSGYAHVDSIFSGLFPILGVYGTGWLALVFAGFVSIAGNSSQALRTKLIHFSALTSFVVAISLLGHIDWSQPQGQPIKVRLLQGNISQDTKFASERVIDSLQLYQRMIQQEPADLIATPETAFPTFMHMLPLEYLQGMSQYAQRNHSHLLLGVPVADGQEHYTNSVIGISPNPDKPFYRYDKHHLVPFGEFIPTGFRWFVDWMHIPLGDFAAGKEVQQPFAVNDVWVMPNICYEDLFGEEIARQLGENELAGKPVANLLLNVSNLAWYGESSAIPQHLQISRARALETGRTMLRSTNTGATAIINPKGKVLHLLAFDQQGVISTKVQGYSGITPYVRYRNLPFLLLASGALLLGWWLGRKK